MSKHNKARIIVNVLMAFASVPLIALAGWKAFDLYDNFSKSDAYVEKMCSPALTKRLTCFCYSQYGRECPLERVELTKEILSEKE